MPWFLCFQSFGISYLEVSISLSWEVLCLVWKDNYVDWFPSAARRRGVHIPNVVPRPRPRTGFRGGDVEHCLLLWWYAVGADQAFLEVLKLGVWIFCAVFSRTKLHVWCLIFQSQCIRNGKRRMLVVFHHVGIEAFYPSRFLCGGSWFSTSASITENFLQSWLPSEADQVGAGSSCPTLWYYWDASVSSRPPQS